MSYITDTLEAQADLLFENVAGWENRTLEYIGARIKKTGKLSVADIKQINNIAVVKQDMEAITKDLARVTGKNIAEIERIYGEVINSQHNANKALYDYRKIPFTPFENNQKLQAIVKAYSRVTGETMINLSKTKALGFVDDIGGFKNLEKTLYDALGKAVMEVSTGSTDFNTAMRRTVEALGGSGVRIDYGGGVTRRLDTAVRQNILWGAKQASVKYNNMVSEELGCDGIEIDWHSNPRPSHAFMQGRQYSLEGKKTVDGVTYESAADALAALEDYGCLHFKTPVILGISELTYSAEELERLNRESNKPIAVDGVEKSGYEWKQAMHRLEAEATKEKEIINFLKAAGDKEGASQHRKRLRAISEKYNNICSQTGLTPQKDRMRVYGGSVNAKTSIESTAKSDIIKTSGNSGELAKPYSDDIVPEEIKDYLSRLTNYGDTILVDKAPSFTDISLMSRQTGTEFASITVGESHYIIKGNTKGTPISNEMFEDMKKHKGTLNCHSHPYIGDFRASREDIDFAKKLPWQDEFYIVSPDGKYASYTCNGIIDIKNIENELIETDLEFYKKLFEE